MDKLIIVFTFSFLLLSLEIFSADEDEQKNVQNRDEKEQSAKQKLQDSYTHVTKSVKAPWERVKYLINRLEISFFPPNLDFRSRNDPNSRGDEDGHNSAGETITKAAGKSFQTSKLAVEESAKTAAKAVGEAAHKTAEKVKGSGKPSAEDSHDEL